MSKPPAILLEYQTPTKPSLAPLFLIATGLAFFGLGFCFLLGMMDTALGIHYGLQSTADHDAEVRRRILLIPLREFPLYCARFCHFVSIILVSLGLAPLFGLN